MIWKERGEIWAQTYFVDIRARQLLPVERHPKLDEDRAVVGNVTDIAETGVFLRLRVVAFGR